MQIQSIDSTRPACRLLSEAFGASVDIVGMSAAEMRWLLGYPGGRRFAWTELRGRGAIHVGLVTDPASQNSTSAETEQPAAAVIETELSDGRVLTRSGQAARLEIGEHHDSSDDRFARSLNLALSQQWARAGLMMVHGAGVVIDSVGGLILGPKAAGKSTLTAAILAQGGRAVSDDWMLAGFDQQGRAVMERMRGFLMLRQSWATERLLASTNGLPFRALAHRPKYTLAADPRDPRFPVSHTIDRVFVLRRPSARSEQTEIGPLASQQALAAMIGAGMPLLFSSPFPLEGRRLGGLAARLLAQAPPQSVACGSDIPSGRFRTAGLLHPPAGRSQSHTCQRVDAEAQ